MMIDDYCQGSAIRETSGGFRNPELIPVLGSFILKIIPTFLGLVFTLALSVALYGIKKAILCHQPKFIVFVTLNVQDRNNEKV